MPLSEATLGKAKLENKEPVDMKEAAILAKADIESKTTRSNTESKNDTTLQLKGGKITINDKEVTIGDKVSNLLKEQGLLEKANKYDKLLQSYSKQYREYNKLNAEYRERNSTVRWEQVIPHRDKLDELDTRLEAAQKKGGC